MIAENKRPIDYQGLIEDIRHELEKLYRFDMNPALVLDAIDILIHEQTGLECVGDKTERCDPANDQLFGQADFVVLTCNRSDPSNCGPIEAWAYQGPLDFGIAKPLVFGTAVSPTEALVALVGQLKEVPRRGVDRTAPATNAGLNIEPPPSETGPEPLFRVVYAIDLYAADPKAAAQKTHQIFLDPESIPPVLHVLDSQGHETTIDLSLE